MNRKEVGIRWELQCLKMFWASQATSKPGDQLSCCYLPTIDEPSDQLCER